MKHRQFLIILSILLVTLIVTLTSCQDRPAAESTPFDTETAAPPTSSEKDYAFLQNPLCKQVFKSKRHELFPPFRNAPNSVTLSTTLAPVPITATFPKTVVINGKTCTVGEKFRHQGKNVGFILEGVDSFEPGFNAIIDFDAITGEIIQIFNITIKEVPIENLKSENDFITFALQTIKENRPDLDIDEYELDSLNSISLEDGGGNVSFVRKIDGIKTTDNISVGIIAGKAMSIRFYDTHEFVDFDETLLNFDKEEHEQMIQSFAEYVCNGYDPVSVENAKTTLVKEADGGYAIEYHLWITADTGETTDSQEYFDFRISLQ